MLRGAGEIISPAGFLGQCPKQGYGDSVPVLPLGQRPKQGYGDSVPVLPLGQRPEQGYRNSVPVRLHIFRRASRCAGVRSAFMASFRDAKCSILLTPAMGMQGKG